MQAMCGLLALGACWAATSATEPEPGFVALFNGRDLTGWDGRPGWWRVENGAITSESTPEKPCERAHYLFWTGGTPGDFELRLQYRLTGGNSGIQFRTQRLPDFDTSGYQADCEAAGQWTGCLFEHARGGVAMRGEDVAIDESGRRTVKPLGDPAALLAAVRPDAWNDYQVTARGDTITLAINGQTMCRVRDQEAGKAARRGVIALQMHPGPPMKVQFRNIRIRIDN
jgi:hypothetical protein